MSFSIVAVTWQSAEDLERLVSSMNMHLDRTPELVVVDNASDDEPEAALREWRGPTQFIRLEENRGFGAAMNLGIAAASEPAVVLQNPDTMLVDGSLKDLAAAALERPALVGPRLLNPDGSYQPSASGPESGIWPWIRAVFPGSLAPSAVKVRIAPWRLDRPVKVTWLTGACIAGRRELLRSLGPFDERIHLYGEDLDLGLRAGKAGIPSYFLPDRSRVVHFGYGSASQRYSDSGALLRACRQRDVLRRNLGVGTERKAWLARTLNLRIRVLMKSLVRVDAARERMELSASRRTRGDSELCVAGNPDP